METDKEEKVMDVAKPGSTTASPTSRSLIVSHGPLMSDPDVKENDREPAAHKEIKPIINNEVTENNNSIKIIENEPITPETKASDTPALDPDSVEAILKKEAEETVYAPKEIIPTGEAEKIKEEVPIIKVDPKNDLSMAEPSNVIDTKNENKNLTADANPSESAAVGAVADQALAQKQTTKQLEQVTIKDAAVQKLIQDKTYFLPTGHDSTKKNNGKNIILVLLILMFLAAGIYLLLDKGTIKINNFEVPYHIIG